MATSGAMSYGATKYGMYMYTHTIIYKKRKEKEKTTPFDVNVMRSPDLP